MRRLCLFLIVCLGLTGLGSAQAAASAPAHPGTQITGPADGSTMPLGLSHVDVSMHDPAGEYEVTVTGCDYGYHESRAFRHYGSEPLSYTLPMPPMMCGGDYSVQLTRTDEYELLDTNYFYIPPPAPAPRITSFSVSEREIWPMVRDGYEDDVAIAWESENYDDAVRVEILNSSGAVVASTGGWIGYWIWKGKNKSGRFVRPGSYKVRLTITNADNRSAVSTKFLKVSHRMAPGTMTYRFPGTRTTKRATRGNCFQNGYDGSLTLDCWGGAYAEATYVFKIPRKAHHLKWRVWGEHNCCERGSFKTQGKRISPTRFRITVRVTDWRSFTIDTVYFRYAARMMFKPSGRLGLVVGKVGAEAAGPPQRLKRAAARQVSASRTR